MKRNTFGLMAHQRALCWRSSIASHHLYERQWSLVGRLYRCLWRKKAIKKPLTIGKSFGNEQQDEEEEAVAMMMHHGLWRVNLRSIDI